MPKWLKRQMSLGLAWDIPAGIGLRSDAGHPSGPAAPEASAPEGQPEGEPAQPEAPAVEETDWKAEARKWEKLAKGNKSAAEQLEKLKASQMSEQEKAVAAAKAEGSAEALKTVGVKLAAAELRSAAKDKGLNLADVADLFRVEQFVDENGDVDEKAIKATVDKLAKIAPAPTPGRSGAPLPGGSGGSPKTNPSLDAAVAARYSK